MEFDPPPHYSPPLPPAAGYVPPVATAPRARTLMIAMTALLSELVIVVATNNQSVTDWVVRKTTGHANSFLANIALSSQSFRWRFSSNTADSLAADYVRDFVMLALTALLVAAVVRGAVTGARAFWGTWMAVVLAAQVGVVVSVFVVPDDHLPGGHSTSLRLFFPNTYTINAYVFVGALGLGLIVAAITALLAVITRTVPPSAPQPLATWQGGGWPAPIATAPPEPPPWTPVPSLTEPPAWTREASETVAPDLSAAEGGAGSATAVTTAIPRWGDDSTAVVHLADDATTALPRWGDDADSQAETQRVVRIDDDDASDNGDDASDDVRR